MVLLLLLLLQVRWKFSTFTFTRTSGRWKFGTFTFTRTSGIRNLGTFTFTRTSRTGKFWYFSRSDSNPSENIPLNFDLPRAVYRLIHRWKTRYWENWLILKWLISWIINIFDQTATKTFMGHQYILWSIVRILDRVRFFSDYMHTHTHRQHLPMYIKDGYAYH